jgi:hypothetical protein
MSTKKSEGEGEQHDNGDFYPPYFWPTAAGSGGRYAELQERVIRDHQRQLNQIGRKIASGDYTPQSMVAEAWGFWARVWGDWADWTRIAYGLDVKRKKEAPGELSLYRIRAVRGEESRSLRFEIESAKLPRERSALSVTSMKSSENNYTIQGENISFEPAEVEPDVRGEQAAKVIVTKVAFEGNQFHPGIYTGTLRAGSRAIGILVLELVETGR